jgi:hypothetical protein
VIWALNGTAVIGGGILADPGPSWHIRAAMWLTRPLALSLLRGRAAGKGLATVR